MNPDAKVVPFAVMPTGNSKEEFRARFRYAALELENRLGGIPFPAESLVDPPPRRRRRIKQEKGAK